MNVCVEASFDAAVPGSPGASLVRWFRAASTVLYGGLVEAEAGSGEGSNPNVVQQGFGRDRNCMPCGAWMMFRTFVEVESMERTDSGTVWGNVWHELEGQYFPSYGWNDLIVPYVTALAHGVYEVAYGRRAEVYFFDGPCSVEMLPAAPRIQIELKGSSSFISGEIEYDDLVSDVASAGNACLMLVSSGDGALTRIFANWTSFWGSCPGCSRRRATCR